MGLFSWLTTSEKAVDTGLDLLKEASSGIDMSFYTNEEKAINAMKIMDQAIEFAKTTHDENTIKSKTRRTLAKMIVINYLLIIDFGILWLVFRNAEQGKNILTLATAAFGTIVLCVVVSHFGYYGVMNILGKKK